MKYQEIAELMRAAGQGQIEPFMRNGASWSGNAYEEARGRASSFTLMAVVFEKLALAESENHFGCICPPGANKDCQNPLCPRKAPAQ